MTSAARSEPGLARIVSPLGHDTVTERDTPDRLEALAHIRSILRLEADSLAAVAERLDSAVARAVEVIDACRSSVIVTGMGKAGQVGAKVASTMASTGTRAHFVHPAEAVHGDLGRIEPSDVVLAISHSGETSELTRILHPIRDQGTRIIGITSRSNSTLARLADPPICYGSVEEACPLKMAPSTSCVVQMAIGDALALAVMKRRGFDAAAYARFHPGGSLGRKLEPVERVMRAGLELRIASARLTVSEVFVASRRPGRRTGAVMLVDDEGRLSGIFTDSDLARLVERRDLAAFDRPVGEIMTRSPRVLRVGQRVLEALELLERHRVSEVPVIDADERPVGLVDITDLVDLLPDR
jgi:arabinose-5-phosphate isomerase